MIDCFPDIDNTLDAAVAESDNVVRCHVVIRGTQEKDFAGIINKGKRFDSDHIFIFHLNPDNKIDNIEIEWDHADFQKHLGSSNIDYINNGKKNEFNSYFFIPSNSFCILNISSRSLAASIKSRSFAAFSICRLMLLIAFSICGMVLYSS